MKNNNRERILQIIEGIDNIKKEIDVFHQELKSILRETEEEKALAEAIEEVLGTERVSMEDNFFNVGGDSISAIYIVSVLEEMGYEVSPRYDEEGGIPP